MADQTYRVKVEYNLDTKDAENGVDRLAKMLDDLKTAAIAAFSLATIKSFIDEVVRLGSEAENATIRLAGMMQAAGARGAENFNDSLRMSAVLIDLIREKSIALPGTWQDLATIVKRNMVFGLNSGLSPVGVMDLSANMQALFGGEHGSQQIARSLQEMLAGHVRGQNPIFQQLNALMSSNLVGDTKGFNALGVQERLKEIEGALDKQKDAIAALQNTWTARLTAIKNDLELVFLAGTQGAFQFFKDTLKGLHEWIQEHRDTLSGYITLISRVFVFVSQVIIGIFRAIGPYITDFLEGVIKPFVPIFLGLAHIIEVVGGYLGMVAEKGEGLRPFVVLIGNLVGIWLVWRAAILAVQVVMTAFRVTMAIFAAINPFTGYVVAIMGIALAVMLALAYLKELQNAFEEMIDTKASRWFLKKAGIIPENASDADIDDAMRSRTRERGGKTVFGQFDDPSGHFKKLFSKEGALGDMGDFLGGFFGKLSFPGQSKNGIDDLLKNLNTKGIVKNGHTNVNVRIEQTVKTDEDPERVRVLTRQGIAEALDQALHHPVETPGSRFSVLRY